MPDDKCTAVRYKIKAAGVHPASMRSHFHFGNMARTEHCNCVLGLSLNNEQFSLPKLQSMAAWIDQRFRKCRILVGDTIYRLTLQIKEHLDEGRSLEKARQIGSATIEQIRHIFDSAVGCQFEIIRCSDIITSSEYSIYYEQLDALVAGDIHFEQSVRNFGLHFLRRNGQATPGPVSLSQSRKYLLEEMAIMCCEYRHGFSVFVYPGSMTTFAEISEGLHPNAPSELKNITMIQLKIDRGGRKHRPEIMSAFHKPNPFVEDGEGCTARKDP